MSEQYYDTDGDSFAEIDVVDTDADGTLDTAFVDVDADGVADAVVVDTDNDNNGVFDTGYLDTKEDAIADAVVVDVDEDGTPDAAFWVEPDATVDDATLAVATSGDSADEDGGQSLYSPPENITGEDVQEAANDLSAQTAIDAGMADTYTAMEAQYS